MTIFVKRGQASILGKKYFWLRKTWLSHCKSRGFVIGEFPAEKRRLIERFFSREFPLCGGEIYNSTLFLGPPEPTPKIVTSKGLGLSIRRPNVKKQELLAFKECILRPDYTFLVDCL